MDIRIRRGSTAELAALCGAIPEFEQPYREAEFQKRLSGVPHLSLIAESGGQAIGFKVGYELQGQFYSWMGGVLPAFRGRGVASLLADHQEKWAISQAYPSILLKTRNQHTGMLIFALKRGFKIVGVIPRETLEANRILLRKKL
jgi:ribosomal protein S18 acetylase RimI-like enzyme